MLRRLMSVGITLICFIFSGLSLANTKKPITIGILVPIALPAMTQIVDGFKRRLDQEYKGKVNYIVKNAQGDTNIQRSILQQFNTPKIDIVAPIGTVATQMTMAMIRNKPIIGIAAEHVKQEAKKANNLNVTGVLDEIAMDKQVAFIHTVLPELKQLTLIHSADSKIFQQVKQAKQAAKAYNIKIQDMMISQLADLYSVSKQIDAKSQAIYILKDEWIVAGINTLVHQAEAKKIPMIASDDGSVSKGAAFALGVSEKQIGYDSADLALKIINGTSASDIPVTVMKEYSVFINDAAAKKQNISIDTIEVAAKKLDYPIIRLGAK